LRRNTKQDAESQWTVDTLHEYLLALIVSNDLRYNQRFEASQSAINTALIAQQTAMATALTAQKLAVDTAQSAADRAVTKSELAADKRFESVNEFRGTLQDQQRTLMPRLEAELLIKQLSEKIDSIQMTQTARSGQKSGLQEGWAYLLGAVGILSLLASIILHFIPPG
jgi:hypothetical protein